jgi:hypothetical protein
VPKRKKPDLLHAMDQRCRPRPDSRAGQCLQTERTAAHARDESVPLNGSEPEKRSLGILAVPDIYVHAAPRGGLDACTATVASGTSSPRRASLATVVADILGTRHTAHLPRPQQ